MGFFEKLTSRDSRFDFGQAQDFFSKLGNVWTHNQGVICSVQAKVRILGPEVIELFSYSTQMSTKFEMLISIKISRN